MEHKTIKNENTINITVDGGAIQDITGIPPGIKIVVVDRNNDGTRETKLVLDSEGIKCSKVIWDDYEAN